MNTIYIPESIKQDTIANIEKFRSASALYDRFGITWKQIILFHGQPGLGKTSFIAALATYFGMHIAKLTVTPQMTSSHIEYLFQNVPSSSFLVIEDVDALFANREAKNGVDFSTLLNCMDGFTTSRGLIAFMTTNHIELLDHAFLRPGRIDCSVKFERPRENELRNALANLASDYVKEHDTFIEKFKDVMTITDIQKHLFDCIMCKKQSILE